MLEFLGVDLHLLCTVGGWRDTMSDDEVLDDLKRWNAGGPLGPEVSFVKQGSALQLHTATKEALAFCIDSLTGQYIDIDKGIKNYVSLCSKL